MLKIQQILLSPLLKKLTKNGQGYFMKYFIFLLLIILNSNLLAVDYYFSWEDYAITTSASPDHILNYTTDGFNIHYHVGASAPSSYLNYTGTGLTEGNSPVNVGNPVATNGRQFILLRNFDTTKVYTLCVSARALFTASGVIEVSSCSNTHTITAITSPFAPTNFNLITTIREYLENHRIDRSVDDICIEAMEYALHINLEKSQELNEIIQMFRKNNNDYMKQNDRTIAAHMSNAYEWETNGNDAQLILAFN